MESCLISRVLFILELWNHKKNINLPIQITLSVGITEKSENKE